MASQIVVGTRGSALALAQTELVIGWLRAKTPDLFIKTKTIATAGDSRTETSISDGVFVKEIEESLLKGEIDLAVHSLKDLPTEPPPGLGIAAVPVRGDSRDGLVGRTLKDLPRGARVGTSSPRRSAQIRRLRPDVQVTDIRGNVPKRISKVLSGDLDAVLLAVAGLNRLGIEADQVFEHEEILPAPGQGAIALEVREDDRTMNEIAETIDDASTRAAVTAERALLRTLGGGCLLPLGTHGRVENGELLLDAAIVSSDGSREKRVQEIGDAQAPEELAERAAARLLGLGALELLK